MFKTVTLLTRRADLTRDAFIELYEGPDGHARLGERVLKGRAARYVRRHLTPVDGGSDGPDVVMEIWYADKAAFEATISALTTPEAAAEIAQDEARLFDRSKTRVYTVEEHESDL